jgi:CheY-like chemotaxis protein
VRFVLCDDDALMRSMIETLVERQGHDVIGAADNTSAATELIVHGRPDAVIVDLSLGYNTDFDILDVAKAIGAQVIVFSHNAAYDIVERYEPHPTIVTKPDLVDLEDAIIRAGDAAPGSAVPAERRVRPGRSAVGPRPTSVGDAQAFYEAVANAEKDDVLASVEPVPGLDAGLDNDDASRIAAIVRETDRVLAAGSTVKVFLAGGEAIGLAAFLCRLRDEAPSLADSVKVRSVLICNGESSADAFDRLKHVDVEHRP